MKKILEVKNLSASLVSRSDRIQAIKDVSFSLYEGEKLGIVGESGSGKSICLKTILKLLPISSFPEVSGEVWYQDQDLAMFSEKQMQKVRGKEISMIFQDPLSALNPLKTIEKQISEGFLLFDPSLSHVEAKNKTLKLLEIVKIPDPEARLSMYPHQLSGGMRQRVLIAIALSTNPKILFADEPTTALDVTVQAQILDLLGEIQTAHKTSILFISHDLKVIAEFCDRVLVMFGGKIVENAAVSELFENPKHPYTKSLIQNFRYLENTDSAISTVNHIHKGCPYLFRCPHAMKICSETFPPNFTTSSGEVSCWIQDARCKK